MSPWQYDPKTGHMVTDVMFEDWTQEQLDLLLAGRRGYLGVADNLYGVATAVFRCVTCGRPFTIVPIGPAAELDTGCGDHDCASYDPARDVFRIVQDGARVYSDEDEAPL